LDISEMSKTSFYGRYSKNTPQKDPDGWGFGGSGIVAQLVLKLRGVCGDMSQSSGTPWSLDSRLQILVEMFQISAIVLTRTVPSTTVSLPASSLTTLLTLTRTSDLNVVTTLDYLSILPNLLVLPN
jgi:hypothetical protein